MQNRSTEQNARELSFDAGRRGLGFTLAEVLVAMAALLVLSVAIGRLFSSVGTLVNTGTASTEVDSLARSIERRIREDIDRLNALPEDQVFIGIRGNRVGDLNLDGALTDSVNERWLYISQADREADERSGIDPSALSSRSLSSTRVDEIVFTAKGPWRSVQQFAREDRVVDADAAIVSYGHGLYASFERPAANLLEDGVDPSVIGSYSRREITPAGLVDGADPWIRAFGQRFTSNEYAGRWPLARRAMLLVGGGAVATEGTSPYSFVGASRYVAPTIRDLENEWFLFDNLTAARVNSLVLDDLQYSRLEIPADESTPAGVTPAALAAGSAEDLPRLGLLRWGRTDIVAQTLGDVQRWFEGQTNPWLVDENTDWPATDYNPPYADASAFSTGLMDVPTPEYMAYNLPVPSDGGTPSSASVSIDSPLWLRAGLGEDSAFGSFTGSGTDPDEAAVKRVNEMALQNAIAGVFQRPLVGDGVPSVRRVAGESSDLDPEVESLDLAFLIANRCSRFEVAWSNGIVVPSDVQEIIVGWYDANADGDFDDAELGDIGRRYRTGELIWFDHDFPYGVFLMGEITTFNASVSEGIPVVSYIPAPGSGSIDADDFVQTYSQEASPEARSTWRLDNHGDGAAPGVMGYRGLSSRDDWDLPGQGIDSAAPIGVNASSVNVAAFGFPVNNAAAATTDVFGGYEPGASGGGSDAFPDMEYLAIWGYRRALGDGEWGAAWQKPRFLRFSMTLHDSEFRLDGGRDYEFVVEVNPLNPVLGSGE